MLNRTFTKQTAFILQVLHGIRLAQVRGFALQSMEFVFNMMDLVLQMIDLVLKSMEFVLNDGLCINNDDFVLK